MSEKQHLSGEDKVIVYCVLMLTVLTIAALVAVIMVPASTITIIPLMAGTVIAISSLAARHPPIASAVIPPVTPVTIETPTQAPEVTSAAT